ncbi:MAG: PDZ domain-containing protein [Planctomycetota bacterium]
MNCNDVRNILSDLIDVRNGEIPPVGVSLLAEPEVRANAESHLASCSDCRAELAALEDVGSVFGDFNVGELPAQHFSNYGQIIRDRIAKSEPKIVQLRPTGVSRWWKTGASFAAAACVAVMLMNYVPKAGNKIKPERNSAGIAKGTPNAVMPKIFAPSQMNIFPVAQTGNPSPSKATYDPAQPKVALDQLLLLEKKYGSVMVSDPIPEDGRPLFGAVIKTTRDEDRNIPKMGSLGLTVYDLVPDSVANEMGLMKNDTIIRINDVNLNSGGVEDAAKFISVVQNLGQGAVITIDLVRQDKSGILYIQRRGVLGQPKAVFE